MTTEKYRIYGIRRDNNLSDLDNKTSALDNVLNNLPGVGGDITFTARDLEPLVGIRNTNVTNEKLQNLAATAERFTNITDIVFTIIRGAGAGDNVLFLDNVDGLEENFPVVESDFIAPGTNIENVSLLTSTVELSKPLLADALIDDTITVSVQQSIINDPLITLQDKIRRARSIASEQGPFPSGLGPKSYFLSSDKIFPVTSLDVIDNIIDVVDYRTDSDIPVDDNFWLHGEFAINTTLHETFTDSYGGVLWEGWVLPDLDVVDHNMSFNTNGFLQIEYRLNSGDDWTILNSIYASDRTFTASLSTSGTLIYLSTDAVKSISPDDIVNDDPNQLVTSINYELGFVQVTNSITVTAGDAIKFSFNNSQGLGRFRGSTIINELFDVGDSFQIRIMWWYDDTIENIEYKYLRISYTDKNKFDFFYLSAEEPSTELSEFEIRSLLDVAVSPTQEELGFAGNPHDFEIQNNLDITYMPRSNFISASPADSDKQIFKASMNINLYDNRKYIQRNSGDELSFVELGNVILPVDMSTLGSKIPLDFKISYKPLNAIESDKLFVNQYATVTDEVGTDVYVVDHIGLIDYFIASSSGDIVTVQGSTEKLTKDMICIKVGSTSNEFIHITEIIDSVSFRTSANLNLVDSYSAGGEYLFVYANSGLMDNSKNIYCEGVFGRIMAANAVGGTNSLSLTDVTDITIGQSAQFGQDGIYLPENTRVTNVTVGTSPAGTVTLDNNLIQQIDQDETITFAPWSPDPVTGIMPNKEVCSVPLDVSPPFLGVDSGLSTNGKNIRSTYPTEFNILTRGLEVTNLSGVTSLVLGDLSSETYDNSIKLKNTGFTIPARLI